MKISYLVKVFKTLTNPKGEYRLTDVQAIAAMDLNVEEYDAILERVA